MIFLSLILVGLILMCIGIREQHPVDRASPDDERANIARNSWLTDKHWLINSKLKECK